MNNIENISETKTNQTTKLSLLYRLFGWCSGARLYILKQCPSEYNKYYGIGVVVFLTGVMASLSGGYAIFTVFSNLKVAIPFGLLWGFLIFSIDWYLVASLRKQQRGFKEFGFALPRFVLAILIAFVISKPLEMKLFEKEIEQQILFNHQQKNLEYQQLISQEYSDLTKLEERNEDLKREILQKEQYRNRLFDMIIAEAEGLSPTKTPGKGPVYKEKRTEFDKVDKELQVLRARNLAQIEANSEEIETIRIRRDRAVDGARDVNRESDGFLARLDAMGTLSQNSTSIRLSSLFIVLLFIVIESAPIIVKLLSARGPYDDMLEAEEYLKQVEIRKIVAQAELTEDHRIDLHRLLEKERNEKLYEVEKDHILSEAKVLSEINKLKVQKWKQEEYSKLQSNSSLTNEKQASEESSPSIFSYEEDTDPGKHFIPEEDISLKDIPEIPEDYVPSKGHGTDEYPEKKNDVSDPITNEMS